MEVKQDTTDSLRAEDLRAVILWLCGEPQEASSILMPLDIQLAEQEYKLGDDSSLGRYVFGSEISYNKPPPRLPGLGC